MKRIIIAALLFLIIIGNMYTQQLGTPTPLQQILNAFPAIPVIGKNIKFEFGGDTWIAKINGENFLVGNCVFEGDGNGQIIRLNITNVWTGAVSEVIDLFQAAGVPLGSAAGPLRTAARLAARIARWIPLEGSVIVLNYNGDRISYASMERQERNRQPRESVARENTTREQTPTRERTTRESTTREQTPTRERTTRERTTREPTARETTTRNRSIPNYEDENRRLPFPHHPPNCCHNVGRR